MIQRRTLRAASSSRKRRAAAASRGLVAHIDGGARGNPGPAGYGARIEDDQRTVVAELYGFLGTATNNTAEYAALLATLEYAVAAGVDSLRVFSDSELLVRQLEGRYRVKDPKMQVLFGAARRLIARLPSFTIAHLPREQNREADLLANLAMDRRESSGALPAALKDLPMDLGQGRLLP